MRRRVEEIRQSGAHGGLLARGERRSLRTKRTLPTGDLDHRTYLAISTGFSTANLLTVGDRHGKLPECSLKNLPVSTGVQQVEGGGRLTRNRCPASSKALPQFAGRIHPKQKSHMCNGLSEVITVTGAAQSGGRRKPRSASEFG